MWVIDLILVDHLQNVLSTPRTIGRGNQPFDIEHVGVHQEVHHRLKVILIRSTDVAGDENSGAFLRHTTAW